MQIVVFARLGFLITFPSIPGRGLIPTDLYFQVLNQCYQSEEEKWDSEGYEITGIQ